MNILLTCRLPKYEIRGMKEVALMRKTDTSKVFREILEDYLSDPERIGRILIERLRLLDEINPDTDQGEGEDTDQDGGTDQGEDTAPVKVEGLSPQPTEVTP